MTTETARRHVSAWAVTLAVAATVVTVEPAAAEEPTHIRSTNPMIAAVMEQGAALSPTFRGLVDAHQYD